MAVPAGYALGRARAHEIAALPQIEVAAASVFPPEDIAPELLEEPPPTSMFEVADAAGLLWVARALDPETPVGFALVRMLDGAPHLHEIDVLPDHARRGVGRALVDTVVKWSRASGFGAITLTTFRHLAWNAPFYARIGFHEIPAAEVGPELRAAIAREGAAGLEPEKRLAMRLRL
jgi:GNAT superfamily N-acetyltransferase